VSFSFLIKKHTDMFTLSRKSRSTTYLATKHSFSFRVKQLLTYSTRHCKRPQHAEKHEQTWEWIEFSKDVSFIVSSWASASAL
jgi:hypothetical protein